MPYEEPDDVIPGLDDAPTATATATAGTEVLFGNPEDEADRIMIPDFAPTMTVEDVERSSFRQVPFGEHVLEVLSVAPQGEPKPQLAYVKLEDGRVERRDYVSQSVKVTLCVPGDDKCTVSFFLNLPPAAPAEQASYFKGFGNEDWARNGKPEDGGREAKRYMQWLGRLGFKQDANMRFPREAFLARNWLYYPGTRIRRLIGCEVIPGKAKAPFERDGQMVTPRIYNQVKNFSFKEVPPPPAAIVGASPAGPGPGPAAPANAQAPAQEAPADPPFDAPAVNATPAKGRGGKKAVAV